MIDRHMPEITDWNDDLRAFIQTNQQLAPHTASQRVDSKTGYYTAAVLYKNQPRYQAII